MQPVLLALTIRWTNECFTLPEKCGKWLRKEIRLAWSVRKPNQKSEIVRTQQQATFPTAPPCVSLGYTYTQQHQKSDVRLTLHMRQINPTVSYILYRCLLSHTFCNISAFPDFFQTVGFVNSLKTAQKFVEGLFRQPNRKSKVRPLVALQNRIAQCIRPVHDVC